MIKAKSFPCSQGFAGISPNSAKDHYNLYLGYVHKAESLLNKLNTVRRAQTDSADIHSLKVDLTYALGAVKNHELFFDIMTPGQSQGGPEGKLREVLEKQFNGVERYLRDLHNTAMASRGWAWTALDLDCGLLFNCMGDAYNTFPMWNAVPIVAIDLYEHAYLYDFGPQKNKYIASMVANLNWRRIESHYAAAMAMAENWDRTTTPPVAAAR